MENQQDQARRTGPLAGLKIIEFGGIGPGPFAAMLLADMGATIVRIDRPGGGIGLADPLLRGRPGLGVNLKSEEGKAAVRDLARAADVLIEGYRPGVLERLGLGPEELLAINPGLVYARMTGFGQHGPLRDRAGHDITYVAISGALHAIGPADAPPPPPLNLVGDFGGGALYLIAGVLAALFERSRSGQGQVIDAAMTDGAASLMGMMYGFLGSGVWANRREANFLDGAAPYYGTYACADGKFIAVGPIEPEFYRIFLDRLGLDPASLPDRDDPAAWPQLRTVFTEIFRSRPRDEWAALFDGTDACVAPVLDMAEAPRHPHNAARAAFVETESGVMPAPAPRFSRTPSAFRAGTETIDLAAARALFGL